MYHTSNSRKCERRDVGLLFIRIIIINYDLPTAYNLGCISLAMNKQVQIEPFILSIVPDGQDSPHSVYG